MVLQMKVPERTAKTTPSPVILRQKVLLVDAVSSFIEAEKSVIQKLDAVDVVMAYSGYEALQIVEKEHPDLVYMDLYMDNMDGDECCRCIKANYGASIRVVLVTEGKTTEDFERCWEAGCDDVITKPIDAYQLYAMTRRFLDREASADADRLEARLTVRHGYGMLMTLTDYSINLSTGGLFLATASLMPADTLLSIEFVLPGSLVPICCKARVAWVNDPDNPKKRSLPPGMGVQFLDISLEDVGAIRNYLRTGRLKPTW